MNLVVDIIMRIIPFTSIVGQEEMKKALTLNAINPRIGGVLLRGEKGTSGTFRSFVSAWDVSPSYCFGYRGCHPAVLRRAALVGCIVFGQGYRSSQWKSVRERDSRRSVYTGYGAGSIRCTRENL